jgi:hypothetical protein
VLDTPGGAAPGTAGRLRTVRRGRGGGEPPEECRAGLAVRPAAAGPGPGPGAARPGLEAAGPAAGASGPVAAGPDGCGRDIWSGHGGRGRRDGHGAGPAGSPLPGSPLPGTALPGSPLPGSPLPGSPLPGSPLPGSPLCGSPLRGSQSAAAGAAGGRPASGWLAAGGFNDGRATALSIRAAAAGGQPSSRRCRPLAAAGPVGRGAAFERVGERTPARRSQIDRRTRSKSRSRISRTPAIACQGVQGPRVRRNIPNVILRY